jgi:hypothetical protein
MRLLCSYAKKGSYEDWRRQEGNCACLALRHAERLKDEG